MDEIPEMRVCSTCKVEKPLTGFYKYKYKGSIKHKAQCKCCVDKKKKENIEEVLKNGKNTKKNITVHTTKK